MTTVAEHLGLPTNTRLMIITADGLGSSRAANQAVSEAIETGLATSAALQVPCPWGWGAAAEHRGGCVGVSLTVNSPHERFRWGPITHAPSLRDGNGGFPATVEDVWEHADLDELMREARAQIERAILWGFDPTFLHAHLSALCSRPEFFTVYLELAVEFDLPITLPDATADLGFPARDLAAAEGIRCPDYVVAPSGPRSLAEIFDAVVNARPGVTELRLQPAADGPEVRALDDQWQRRVAANHALCNDWELRAAIERSAVTLISFGDMRNAQRETSTGER